MINQKVDFLIVLWATKLKESKVDAPCAVCMLVCFLVLPSVLRCTVQMQLSECLVLHIHSYLNFNLSISLAKASGESVSAQIQTAHPYLNFIFNSCLSEQNLSPMHKCIYGGGAFEE